MSKIPSREEALFADALAQPPAQREAFLARTCGADAGLIKRVAALLAAHEAPASLLGTADCAAQRINAIPEEKPGDLIGRYKLLLKIGEGGCGVVFLAEQKDPVRRRVALKVIKVGMDTREVITRFEAERQALALMDHPNICKVLDAGATLTGRPYFVMEFVRGAPITKYCDDNQLTTQARLELFMQVCHAVQHAHQKGIIHRDLKPSNILVTLNETGATPKVIDFGIAKATQGRLTDATLVTAFEQFLGTPAYMSPEQAEMRGLDIDTRSDVYSLGVLLYELLSGRPPFDPKMLMTASRDELRRIIREVDPPKPSTQLATLGASDRTTVAQRRGTEPAKLRQLLAGDLDWIVMRALEKNRVRRYETPAALADDIGRHFRHELVVARPPGSLYRAGRFILRHRLGVSAATTVGLVLIAGTIVSTFQAVRAKKAEHVAKEERSRAQAAAARAETLIDFMLGEFRTEVQKVGKLDLLESVGDKATAYFASLEPRDLSDEALVQQVKWLRQIGEVQIDKARFASASETFAAVFQRASALVARQPANGELLFERAQAEFYIGFVYRKRGNLTAASEWLMRYRDSGAELFKMKPDNRRWKREYVSGHHNLAVLDLERGKVGPARSGFMAEMPMIEEMIAAVPGDLSLQYRVADVHSWLGSVAERSGDFAGATERFERSIRILESLVKKEPLNTRWRVKLVDTRALGASLLAMSGRRVEWHSLCTETRVLFEQLESQDPSNRGWLTQSLIFRLTEAMVLKAEGKADECSRLVADARTKLQKLLDEEPSDRKVSAFLMTAWRLEAELRHGAGQNSAIDAANQADSIGQLLATGWIDDLVRSEQANVCIVLARIVEAGGSTIAARSHWQRAADLVLPLVSESTHWRVLDPAARVLAALDRHSESRAVIERLQQFGYHPLEPWPQSANLSGYNDSPKPK